MVWTTGPRISLAAGDAARVNTMIELRCSIGISVLVPSFYRSAQAGSYSLSTCELILRSAVATAWQE